MKCEHCNENEATVHYTEIEGAEKREIHLCEECYRQKLVPVQNVTAFADVLKGLLQSMLKERDGAANAICPTCGLSLAEFHASGRLGCPNDYRVFSEAIELLVEKIQHSNRHMGKVPSRAGVTLERKNTLIRLRRELERAVQREEYEAAAKVRDKIRKLAGSSDESR